MRINRARWIVAALIGVAGIAVLARARETAVAAEGANGAGDSDRAFHEKIVPFLVQNCYECHGNGNHKGNLELDSLKRTADVVAHRDQWESVLIDLRGGVMPRSEAKKFPSFAERNAVADWVEHELTAYAAAHPDPGPAAVHRLGIAEYVNTIRDLVRVEFVPGSDFPADETVKWSGLAASNASLTPDMKGKYLAAAGRIVDENAVVNLEPSRGAGEENSAARKYLETFAGRAWRRPVEEGEVDGLMGQFSAAQNSGISFREAL